MSPPPAPSVNDHPRGQARHSAQHWLPFTGLSPRHAEPLAITETTQIVLWERLNTLSCIWHLIDRFPFHRGNRPQNFKNHSHYKMLFLHINDLHWYHTERLVKSTLFGTQTSINSSSDALTWLLFGTWKRPWQAPFPPRGNNAIEVLVLKFRVLLLFSHLVVSDFCNPVNCSTSGCPVLHCLPEFAQTHVHWDHDAIQLSHPPLPPALNLSQHQGLFQWVGSSYQSLYRSFSISLCGGLYMPFQCGIAFPQGLWWLNLKKWREMEISDAMVSQEESNCEQKVQQPSVLQIIPCRWSLSYQVYSALILKCLGTSLVVHWLRPSAPKAGGPGSIPGQGTRSHMMQRRPSTAK